MVKPKRKPKWIALKVTMSRLRIQIAELEAEIAASARPSRPRRRRARKARAKPLAAAPAIETQITADAPRAIEVVPSPQEIWPGGSDLAEPKSFGVKPPFVDLEQGSESIDAYGRRLKQHRAFATQVLHTSGVVAVVWRDWRTFARAVEEKLRTLNAAPPRTF
jgi:hypothetical protein